MLRDERISFSDAETEGPSEIPEEVRIPANEASLSNIDVPAAPPEKKRGRGPARSTEFDRIRKFGKIAVEIKDGQRGVSCQNATMFSTRVTWIVKIYADMRHASWSRVDKQNKDELTDRVRADFVLDWTKSNHRETVAMALAQKYNDYHYLLHGKYMEYDTHEAAISGGTKLVDKAVWQCLCERWGSEDFKNLSARNKQNRSNQRINHTGGRKSFVRLMEEKREQAPNYVAFYKEVHWSRKKGRFVTEAAEQNYNMMVELLNEMPPEDAGDDNANANAVFKEVLGSRSGYVRGLGHLVIPEPSESLLSNREFIRLREENEKNKAEAEGFKRKLETFMVDVSKMQACFEEFDRLNSRVTELESQRESQRETPGDA
ncbi:uncharacterized protein LOC108980022 [Juglans regia]|nr:uncharacterized protein LOC108980022 [Juglans regia]